MSREAGDALPPEDLADSWRYTGLALVCMCSLVHFQVPYEMKRALARCIAASNTSPVVVAVYAVSAHSSPGRRLASGESGFRVWLGVRDDLRNRVMANAAQ
jgi:hypothetical protein